MNNFSENLKKIRKDNNLSQENLADALGVSRQAISKWESAVAYPEMDKILQICKMFDLNIDDLLNKDIRETKGEQETKNKLNKYIDDFLTFISDTVNLFSNMTFKTKVKCIFEQFVIIGFLSLLLLLIGSIGEALLSSLIFSSNIYYYFHGVLSNIYLIFSLVVELVILVHIFKARYLDYYKNYKSIINEESFEKEEKDSEASEEKKNKVLFKNDMDKIIIRDPKHSEYKFLNAIIKMIVFAVKMFVLFIALPLCVMLPILFIGVVLSFLVIKTKLVFIGLILCMLSMALATVDILLLLFNFILNRKNDKKKMIWAFIISLCAFGISIGFITVGMLDFSVIEQKDHKNMEIDMSDNLIIEQHGQQNIEYIEKDIDNIYVEYETCTYCSFDYDVYFEDDKKLLYFVIDIDKLGFLKETINQFNNKKIINSPCNMENIKLYTSKKNIEKLKENSDKYFKELEQYEEYENRIIDLEEKLEEKEIDIQGLKDKVYDLEHN